MTINNIVSTLNDSSTTASLLDSYLTSIDVENGIIVLRGIEAGPGISLQIADVVSGDDTPQKIIISATGTSGGFAYTGSNLGSTGEAVFAGLTGNQFDFKTLVAGPGINMTSDGETIVISVIPTTTVPPTTQPQGPQVIGENLGTGLPIYAGTSNNVLSFNSLEAGNGITITNNQNGTLFVSSNQNITTNTGGIQLFNGNAGNVEFKAIAAGQNITITDGNIITISATIPQISYNNLLNLPTIPQHLNDLVDVFAQPSNGQVLTWNQFTNKWIASNPSTSVVNDPNPTLGGNLNVNGYSITSTGNIVLTATGNTVIGALKFPTTDGAPGQVLSTDGAHNLVWTTISQPTVVNSYQNIGTGIGVYSGTSGQYAQFNSIAAASNKIVVANGTNTVTVDVYEQNLNLANMSGILPISLGGTGATNPIAIRTNLGLGSLSTQNANNVSITGGSITVGSIVAGNALINGYKFPQNLGSIGQVLTTDGAGNLSWQTVSSATSGQIVGITNGGTGASDTSTARSNLGLGSMALQNANSVAITGGNVSGVNISNASITTSSFSINGLAFPTNSGISGQVLTTDGAGNLTWTSLPTGSNVIGVSNGGTGASDPVNARTNLGLGTLSTQNSSSVTITGGNIAVANLTVSGNVKLNGLNYPISIGSAGQVLSADGQGNLTWTTIATNPVASITQGGTGASDVVTARTNLGLGSLATQNTNAISVTGGTISISNLTVTGQASLNGNIYPSNFGSANQVLMTNGNGTITWQSPLANTIVQITQGGTGAASPAAARSNLGLGTMATQNANSINIYGGSITGTNVSATSLTASGTITLNNMTFPSTLGSAGQVLMSNGNGTLSWTTIPTGGSGQPNSVYTLETDTAPTLAGNLNLNGFAITASSDVLLSSATGNVHINSPLMVGNGNFAVMGDASSIMAVLRCQSTTSTATELFLDGLGQQLTVPTNATWMVKAKVVARRIDIANSESASFELIGCVDNTNGSTTVINQITKIIVADGDGDWDANMTVSNNSIQIFGTGENNKTIKWVAFVSIVQTF